MSFSLIKAIKSTHRHPINRILHCIGAPLYITGIAFILENLFGLYGNIMIGVILFLMAIGLFLLGHKIEGNIRAMTLIILFKYASRTRFKIVSQYTDNFRKRLQDSYDILYYVNRISTSKKSSDEAASQQ
jgi:uncharacterized membrane protein YGL010W